MNFNNQVILDIGTYQETLKKIEKLENSDSQQEIQRLKKEVQNLETQNRKLLTKIDDMGKYNNLFLQEHSLVRKYEKSLYLFFSLSFFDRIFRYRKIRKTIKKENQI